MASIRKRGNGWQVQIRRSGFDPTSKTFRNGHDAQMWARQLESEMDRGIYFSRTPAERTTLASLFERYAREVTLHKASARREKQRLHQLDRIFGRRFLAHLQTPEIAAYRDSRLSEGLAGATVLKELNTLSLVVDTARRDWGIYLPQNPCELVRRPKIAPGRSRRLLPGEEEKLLEACRRSRAPALHTIVCLALETAMRLGELTRIAGHYRRLGYDAARIEAELLAVNSERCDPPLAPEELALIARSVSRYPAGSLDVDSSLTDTGNADRFVKRWGNELRYVHMIGKWRHWNGSRWRTDESGIVVEFAKKAARSIYEEAAGTLDSATATRLAKHATASLGDKELSAMIKLAQSKPPIPARIEDFDAGDDLIGVASGTIDLCSGEHQEPRAADLITKQSAARFDPTADCPNFKLFLNRVMGGNDDLVRFLQRAVGYSLTGSTNEHCLFFLYGSGANGKSTFLNVIGELLGDYAVTCPPETLMVKKSPAGANNDVARLVGARVVMSSEVEDGSRFAETLIKQMTGGDTLTARQLYREFFEFKPKFKLWIAGNHKPIIRGDDYAIWRRIRLIPFTVTIPESERDPRLLEKLRAELPGILNWAIEGCLEWRKSGLKPPTEVVEAVEEYRSEMDLIGQWMEERCVRTKGKSVRASVAYDDYRIWSDRAGHRPLTKQRFGAKLTERGIRRRHTEVGTVYDDLEIAASFEGEDLDS